MSTIFLIPGLGADCRIFQKLELGDNELINVDWIKPEATDTLATYAQKLIGQNHITEQAIVIGNSLGGMIAVEIAKLIPLKKVILISSIKTIDEAPWYFRLFRAVPVYKIIPGRFFTSIDFLLELIFGEMEKDDKKLFKDMLKNTSAGFLKWAMSAILHWENKTVPQDSFTITGDKDLVFNYRRINDATIVKGGTHVMIFDKAEEVSKLLHNILEK